jgi:hypothetical protein
MTEPHTFSVFVLRRRILKEAYTAGALWRVLSNLDLRPVLQIETFS